MWGTISMKRGSSMSHFGVWWKFVGKRFIGSRIEPTQRDTITMRGAGASETRERLSFETYYKMNHKWNEVVCEAETLVGFPTSFLRLQSVFMKSFASSGAVSSMGSNNPSDMSSSVLNHFRKLMSSEHPVLRTVKRLFFHHHGKSNIQVRGLILLLLHHCTSSSWGCVRKTLPPTSVTEKKDEAMDDVSETSTDDEKVRCMAECLEMIYSAQLIHKSILHIPNIHFDEQSAISPPLPLKVKDDALQKRITELEYGNKIALLTGDFLLSTASVRLSKLGVPRIVELFSTAIAHCCQSAFEVDGLSMENASTTSHATGVPLLGKGVWLSKTRMSEACILPFASKSLGALLDYDSEQERLLERLGYNISIALEIFSQILSIGETCSLMVTDDENNNYTQPPLIDLNSIVVCLHFQKSTTMDNSCDDGGEHRHLLHLIHQDMASLREGSPVKNNLNYKQILESIRKGRGMMEAQKMCNEFTDLAISDLRLLVDSSSKEASNNSSVSPADAKRILMKILQSITFPSS